MNIETHINKNLWNEIKDHYEATLYTEAIKDGIFLITKTLREKADIDGDGTQLVGAALGGTNPKIKVNALQTQTERDIQTGTEALLRGLYSSIRNPRSHEKIRDSKKDADAIIIFIDYLLSILNASRSLFSVGAFLERVFEPNLPKNIRYIDLLIDEIPEKFKFDVFVEVYRRKESGDASKLALFIERLLKKLSSNQITEVCNAVSSELLTTNSEKTVRFNIQLFCANIWKDIQLTARLRTENWLIESIRNGRYVPHTKQIYGGSLGTWANNLISTFELKDELRSALYERLSNSDKSARCYVSEYFSNNFFKVIEPNQNETIAELIEQLNLHNTEALEISKRVVSSNKDFAPLLSPQIQAFVQPASDEVPF